MFLVLKTFESRNNQGTQNVTIRRLLSTYITGLTFCINPRLTEVLDLLK
jgi:hypothetical protein